MAPSPERFSAQDVLLIAHRLKTLDNPCATHDLQALASGLGNGIPGGNNYGRLGAEGLELARLQVSGWAAGNLRVLGHSQRPRHRLGETSQRAFDQFSRWV